MITRWWWRVVSCLYPHLCPDHFASFSTFGFFRGLHKSDSRYRRVRRLRQPEKTLCGHAIIWCEAPWPYSPRGPGEGGNGQLISVNCDWVRASEQPFPCSEAWLLWLLAGQEIQTLYCLVSTLSAGLPIPGPWQLTALCSTLGRTLSRAVKPQEPDRVLMSAIGTQRQAVSGSPGRRQCSVYLGPQSGGHPPGQQLQWHPDGQHQDPDVGGHGHWPYCCVTNSYKYQGQAENLITQTIKSAPIKLVITSNSITTKCYNCIQLWIFTMTRWQHSFNIQHF